MEKLARTKKKLVFGVGINDSAYNVIGCKFYFAWKRMLQRCYSQTHLEKNPTYKGCSVSKEWLTFTNFRTWMKDQKWEGKSLDKDIVIPNNKVYSAETCVFVDAMVNCLLLDRGKLRGKYPRGVTYSKRDKVFVSSCNNMGVSTFLGNHHTADGAANAYRAFKYSALVEVAHEQEDERVKRGLLAHAKLIQTQT